MIRDAVPDDAASVAEIYNHYVAETVVTFEETAVSGAEMRERLAAADDGHPWLVLEEGGAVLGFAFASPWKSRCAYRHSVESSVYLAPGATGRGLGTGLYAALLDRLAAAGRRSALGGIALPNEASVALHEKLGFEKVGRFREVGFKFDRWIDVGYWQKRFPDARG